FVEHWQVADQRVILLDLDDAVLRDLEQRVEQRPAVARRRLEIPGAVRRLVQLHRDDVLRVTQQFLDVRRRRYRNLVKRGDDREGAVAPLNRRSEEARVVRSRSRTAEQQVYRLAGVERVDRRRGPVQDQGLAAAADVGEDAIGRSIGARDFRFVQDAV